MISLHIDAETTAELIHKALTALGITMVAVPPNEMPVAPPDIAPDRSPLSADPEPAKKRGRPPLTSVPATAPAAPAAPAAAQSDLTYELVKAALQKSAENKPGESGTIGLERTRSIIAKYGYRKVKDIKPEHYKNIMDECAAHV